MNLQRLKLETTRENLLARFIDLLAPLAKGQRGLIVGPRHMGQNLILETIASSVAVNHPEVARP
jgi:transcription termination factor Rho